MKKLKRVVFCIGLLPAMLVDLLIWIWTGEGFVLSNKLGNWSENVPY